MKYFFAVLCSAIAVLGFDKETFTQMLKDSEDVIDECAAKIHPTNDDLSELYGFHLPPSSHEAKCMIYCVYDSFKAVEDNGTFKKNGAWNAVAKLKYTYPAIYKAVVKTMEICARDVEITADPCENVSNIAACWIKNESGIEMKYL